MALKADPMDDERFDGMYLQVAQTIGGIDPLLDSFFGFLRRKTDFFAGAADPAKARETVLAAFEKNKERSDEELKEKAAKEKKRKADEEKRRARLAEEKAKVQKQGSVAGKMNRMYKNVRSHSFLEIGEDASLYSLQEEMGARIRAMPLTLWGLASAVLYRLEKRNGASLVRDVLALIVLSLEGGGLLEHDQRKDVAN